MKLALIPVRPYLACERWDNRGIDGEEGPFAGGQCCWCNLDVAVPARARDKHVCCTYCALDRGLVLEIDVPLGQPTPSTLPGARVRM